MSILDTLEKISYNDHLMEAGLKFCFMDENKLPFRFDHQIARSNQLNDFVDFSDLMLCDDINKYKGVAISIQASNICAIDVDHCFSTPFDSTTGDSRAKDIIDTFKDLAYIEFSFSGTGLRVLLKMNCIPNYVDSYYIKNSKQGIEFYQPTESFRYVSITGHSLYNNEITRKLRVDQAILGFLNKYMTRPKFLKISANNKVDERPIEQLFAIVKRMYYKDARFQDLWFTKAPGSGHDESERDFCLVRDLYENVTQDKEKIKQLFEMSPFYKTKDWKHKNKWSKNNFAYYYYIYKKL